MGPCAASQVLFVNDAIRKARPGSPLHGLAPIVDPSDEIIEVLLAALLWDMQQLRFGLTAEGLDKLHALSVELLALLKENMPYRTGGPELEFRESTQYFSQGTRHSAVWLV